MRIYFLYPDPLEGAPSFKISRLSPILCVLLLYVQQATQGHVFAFLSEKILPDTVYEKRNFPIFGNCSIREIAVVTRAVSEKLEVNFSLNLNFSSL